MKIVNMFLKNFNFPSEKNKMKIYSNHKLSVNEFVV